MTVTATNSRNDYVGNGATTAFTYSFRIFAAGDILVYVDNELKTLGADYSVAGVGSDTGTVTFTVAPATGTAVSLISNIADTQTTDIPTNDKFPALAFENALDKLTRMVQQVRERIQRSPALPVSSTIQPVLPPPGAGKFIRWNTEGTNLEAVAQAADIVGVVDDAVPVSTFSSFPAAGTTGRLRVASNNVRGLWLDQGSEWVPVGQPTDVRLFGAECDGVTNDAADIEQALGVTSIMWVFLPKNTLWIPTGAVPAGKRITGDDWSTCIIDARTSAGGPGFFTVGQNCIVENVTIKDDNGTSRIGKHMRYDAHGTPVSWIVSGVGQDVLLDLVKRGANATANSVGMAMTHHGPGSGDNYYAQTTSDASQFVDALFRGDLQASAAGGASVFRAVMSAGAAVHAESSALSITDLHATLNKAMFYQTTAKTGGDALGIQHGASAWATGTMIHMQAKADGAGSFGANFLVARLGADAKFTIKGAGTAEISHTENGITDNLHISGTGTSGANIKLTGDGGTTPKKWIDVRAGKFEVRNDGANLILQLLDSVSSDGLTVLHVMVHDGGTQVMKQVKADTGAGGKRMLYVDD